MKYTEHKALNYAEIGREMLDFHKAHKVFEESVRIREGKPAFTFYEGPPSANGMPGIHHVMARAIKDIFCRYKTQKGYQVKRKGGWDTHGLPVELQVEKELGITKEDIGKKISVEEYNQKCREAVMRFKSAWDEITEKMGYWVDLDKPYVTFENDYIESVWSLLKKLYDKGLLYKGYTIQPYSPAAGTGLSSHELNMPGAYQDVKDVSVTAQFKLKGSDNDYLLAWTTTPWTLPSNSALVVNPNIDYVKVETRNLYTHTPIHVILAKALVNKVFAHPYLPSADFDEEKHKNKVPYSVIEEFKGDTLVGLEYEQLLPYVQPLKNADKAFRVIPGDFVTTEDGTGIVHAAPTFGADDFRAAQQNGVPAITVLDENDNEVPLVDKQGRFVKEVTDFAGDYVKEQYESAEKVAEEGFKSTDVRISVKLKEENKAFRVEKYEHNYPHCWRTDKPVLYYPLDSWFIRTTKFKDRLIELNKTINWKPASTGEGRFGNWLENLVDWNLSRSRFWGTPLPIWRSEDGKEERCIGSKQELFDACEEALTAGLMPSNPLKENEDFDLHRPYVDNIVLKGSKGQALYREPDLIDVWFDSGSMPYAQWHFPFENEEIFKANYPADFIAEGVDQTRGWFFTLHAIAVMLYDSVAFKNVIANGLVLDKNGNKMSKRLGNAVNPFEAIDKYGIDPLRWYMIENAPPWDNLKFDTDGVVEVQRKFFGTLQNTYSFFAIYANLDNFVYDAGAVIPLKERAESDRWIISKLNSLIKNVDEAFEAYEPTRAARLMSAFATQDLSNWYVRLNRKRFWKAELNDNKRAAYQTLYECLRTLSGLAAPIAPFYSDKLYRDLLQAEGKEELISVHLSDFPKANEAGIDRELEIRMDLAQRASSLAHSLRKKEKIRVRQPLGKILIPVLNEQEKERFESVRQLILGEVNVKEMEFIGSDSGILVKKIKPNFRKLGKQFGKQMKVLNQAIQAMSQDDINKAEASKQFTLLLEGKEVSLGIEDVEITSESIEGWEVAHDEGLTVALDITLSESLEREGLARDFVNRIQNLRKDKDFEVQDRISIRFSTGSDKLEQALTEFNDYISVETQADSLKKSDAATGSETMDIEGYEIEVALEVIG